MLNLKSKTVNLKAIKAFSTRMNKMASMTLSFDVKKKLKEKERTRLNMIFLYETEPKDKPIMPNEKWLPT